MRSIIPSNLGWLEDTLSSQESGKLWQYIYKAKEDAKLELLGHVDSSLYLRDEGDWFLIRYAHDSLGDTLRSLVTSMCLPEGHIHSCWITCG